MPLIATELATDCGDISAIISNGYSRGYSRASSRLIVDDEASKIKINDMLRPGVLSTCSG